MASHIATIELEKEMKEEEEKEKKTNQTHYYSILFPMHWKYVFEA